MGRNLRVLKIIVSQRNEFNTKYKSVKLWRN